MTDHYFLPDVPMVDATPELLCRIMDQLPEHQEGDYFVSVDCGSLADLLEAAGHDVTIGYQKFGGNAEDPEDGDPYK